MDENKTKDTLKALKDTYDALKNKNGKKNTLKTALNTVISLFPNVTDNNGDAWRALTEKQNIKTFYNDFISADYAEEKNCSLEDAQKEVLTALHDFFNSIKGNPNAGGKNAYNQYLQEISDHDITNDFQCDLLPANNDFKPINFPASTLSIIAGRPSCGKTTALASIAMYAMRKTNKNVLFVTSEETTNQIITRFIKNQFCENCLSNGNEDLLNQNFKDTYINETFKDIINKNNKNPSLFFTEKTFPAEVLKAANDVEEYIKAGRLQLFDLDKTNSFEELKDRLQELEKHSIVIIDYIQNLPYAPSGTPNNDRFESLRQQIFAINAIIKANKLIGIAGAQCNREGASEHDPDALELNKLGESGEIERKAHIAIGLGRKINEDNSITYFYRVMKDREGNISAHFQIKNYYPYSYLTAYKIDDNGKMVLNKIYTKTEKKPGKSKAEQTENKKGKKAAATTGDVIDRKNDKPILI